jgi:hypothetical protein
MDTSISTAQVFKDERKYKSIMMTLVRNLQMFAQFRDPLPDGTTINLFFTICHDLQDYIMPEGIKTMKPLPFRSFEMVINDPLIIG